MVKHSHAFLIYNMKRGDHEFQCSDKAIMSKWFDNRAVHLLGSNVEGFDAVSVVSRRQKGVATKGNVSCPAMVKIYNHGMGGVELMDQYSAAYRLDRRARFRFYLRIFFRPMGCWLYQFQYCLQSNLPQKARIP